jgi:hypothetical protein
MYCRFYLLVNTPILYSLPGLSQQPSPTASLLESLLTSAPPSTSKWELFSFVCLVAQPCQSCDIRAQACNGVASSGGLACHLCLALTNVVADKYLSLSSENVRKSNHVHWPRQQIAIRLDELGPQLQAQKLELMASPASCPTEDPSRWNKLCSYFA